MNASAEEPPLPKLYYDGPEDAPHGVILTHGAGAPVTDPFLETITAGFVARGVRVVRFEFPYMEKRREDGKKRGPDRAPVLETTWRNVIEHLGGGARWVIGGKSMGGRIASMVAEPVGARGLVCFGYPFHPPGRPERLRTAHLESIETPTLIVQGTRDALGSREEIDGLTLSPRIRFLWLMDGDHSFKPRKRSGETVSAHLERAVECAVEFVIDCGP